MTLHDRIIKALSPLVGLPLWGSARALNMEMFAFGQRRTRPNRKGQNIEVGEYALHVQCPWRITSSDGIVVGSGDVAYPKDETADWAEHDAEKPSRCEARIQEWLKEHSAAPLKVERVEADRVGGFTLFLQHHFCLEVFPAHSRRNEYSEHWRLFRPSQPDHFVVAGYGIQE